MIKAGKMPAFSRLRMERNPYPPDPIRSKNNYLRFSSFMHFWQTRLPL